MSRPKKQMPPAKTHQLPIRFTEDLYDTLCKDASSAGLSVSEYIRQLITNKHPVVRQEIVFNDERILHALRNLGHMRINLNLILSILVDTFISKISLPMQPGPEIGSISGA